MRKLKIGRRAILPMLVVLFMVMGSFGTNLYTQNAGTAASGLTAGSASGETGNFEQTSQETVTQTDLFEYNGLKALDFSNQEEMDELKAQGIVIPEEPDATDHTTENGRQMQRDTGREGTKSPWTVQFTQTEYGTEAFPHWEGDTINFFLAHSGALFLFRYNLDDDPNWEMPDGSERSPSCDWTDLTPGVCWTDQDWISYTYPDDFYGQAYVEAWDGFSTVTFFEDGIWLEEPSPYWYMYLFGQSIWTIGTKFTATENFRVVELGWYKDFYQAFIYQIAVYDITGGPARCYASPLTQSTGWQWRNAVDAFPGGCDLTGGTDYILGNSARMRYTFGYYHRATNGMPAADEVVDPISLSYFPGISAPILDSWTDRAAMIDIHWERSFDVPDVATDVADVWVQNVVPHVYAPGEDPNYPMTVTPDPALEGNSISLEAWFDDAGTEDTYEYNIQWGDGTETGWISIPLGTGMYGLNNVIYWQDNINDVPGDALAELSAVYGFPYEVVPGLSVAGINNFYDRLDEQQFDLVLADNYYIVWVDPESHYGPLRDQVAGGAELVFFTWGLGYGSHSGHEFWSDTMGVDYVSQFSSPPTFFEWDLASPVFSVYSDVRPGPIGPSGCTYFMDGQYTNPEDFSHGVGGWTPFEMDDRHGLIVRDDMRTIYNAFASDCYSNTDGDFDGQKDAVELWANEISTVVGPSVKFEMPYQLTATHTYVDDEPSTSNSSTSFLQTTTTSSG
jgi:hypothetical protein